MYKKFKARAVLTAICALGACLGLTACAEENPRQPGEPGSALTAPSAMESAPVIEYAVPQQRPNILTDRRGYSSGSIKQIVVRAKELPETFYLVDAQTGETVYEGLVEKRVYDEASGCYAGYADFSQVKTPGVYYVSCSGLGRSYSFSVSEQLYRELFQEVYEKLSEDCGNGRLSIAEMVKYLEVYEWYREIFPDKNRNGTPDVLEQMQVWVTRMEEKEAEAGQQALYAAFLAKFSYNYKDYHYEYASECLKRAATVYGQLSDDAGSGMDRFFALAELYRATGLSTYHSQLLEYKDTLMRDSDCLEEDSCFYGSLAYLMTRQRMDRDLCESLMEHIMGRAEKISWEYTELLDPLRTERGELAGLMKRARDLSCANYILNNYQYTNIVREFLHYLMGRNLESVNFYEEEGCGTDYLLLFAQLAVSLDEAAGE